MKEGKPFFCSYFSFRESPVRNLLFFYLFLKSGASVFWRFRDLRITYIGCYNTLCGRLQKELYDARSRDRKDHQTPIEIWRVTAVEKRESTSEIARSPKPVMVQEWRVEHGSIGQKENESMPITGAFAEVNPFA
jgi:hypothetical protein